MKLVGQMNKEEAIKILEKIDPSTVIDIWWYKYITGRKILTALLSLSGYSTYKEFLEKFEGFSISEVLIYYTL